MASVAGSASLDVVPPVGGGLFSPPLLSSEEIFVLFCFYDSVIFHSNFTIAKGEKTESSSQRSCVFFKNFQCHRYISVGLWYYLLGHLWPYADTEGYGFVSRLVSQIVTHDLYLQTISVLLVSIGSREKVTVCIQKKILSTLVYISKRRLNNSQIDYCCCCGVLLFTEHIKVCGR